MILHGLIAMVAGWLQRHQQQAIAYLLAENRILKAHLSGRRLRFSDTERRRLAVLAHPLGRKRLEELATLVTPDCAGNPSHVGTVSRQQAVSFPKGALPRTLGLASPTFQ